MGSFTVPTVSSALARVYYSSGAGFADGILDALAYRPPEWFNGEPGFTLTAQDPQTGEQTAYVFDAPIRAEHAQQVVATTNPVQDGAQRADHAFTVPPKVVVEILMSDSMQSFVVGQWNGGPSKSVVAFQALLAIQERKIPVAIATRLRSYDRMLITDVRAEETKETLHALKAWITFTGILVASVQAPAGAQSAMPQTTSQTIIGQVQTQPVPSAIQTQNNVNSAQQIIGSFPAVPGAGMWSSANVATLSRLL